MTTVDELVSMQEASAIEIDKTIASVKKAPLDRRNLEFYKKKSIELTELWNVFERQDNAIRRNPALSDEHPYLAKNIYDSTKAKFCAITEEIEQAINSLKTKPSPALRESTTKPEIKSMVRRQRALIVSLERLLQGQAKYEAPMQTIVAIDKLWTNIEEIHLTVHEICDTPSREDYDVTRYLELEEQVL